MPEQYHKRKWRHRPAFGLEAAGEFGNLLKVKCRTCRRTRYFIPADLVELYGDHEVDDITFTCTPCGTNRMVVVSLHSPAPGDWGSIDVWRPLPPVEVIKWRRVKLGDEVPGRPLPPRYSKPPG